MCTAIGNTDKAPLVVRIAANLVAIALLPILAPAAVIYHLVTKRRVP